ARARMRAPPPPRRGRCGSPEGSAGSGGRARRARTRARKAASRPNAKGGGAADARGAPQCCFLPGFFVPPAFASSVGCTFSPAGSGSAAGVSRPASAAFFTASVLLGCAIAGGSLAGNDSSTASSMRSSSCFSSCVSPRRGGGVSVACSFGAGFGCGFAMEFLRALGAISHGQGPAGSVRYNPVMVPDYWPQAKSHLARRDKVLKKLIRDYPDADLKTRGDAFQTLCRSIVGQQISVKAAQSIWARFAEAAGTVAPRNVTDLPVEVLRACGLSGQKALYLKDLAAHFGTGAIRPRRWARMSDEAIIEDLVRVKGIGRWTVEM